MVLNNAKDIRIGERYVDRVYQGNNLIWGLPKGYKLCKYLECSATQYIDTNVIPDNNTGAFLTASVSKMRSDRFIWGCRELTSTNSRFIFGVGNSNRPYVGFGSYYYIDSYTTISANQIFTIFMNYLNSRTAHTSLSQEVRENLPNLSIKYTKKIIIGGSMNESNINLQEQKVYKCGISYEQKIIRYFIPALDENGKPCLYDTISKQPFYNNGTGEFGYELLNGTYVAPN